MAETEITRRQLKGKVAARKITRDMTAATGDQAITGLGFQPTFIQFEGSIDGNRAGSIRGRSDASDNECLQIDVNGAITHRGAFCLYIEEGAVGSGDYQRVGTVVMDSDGFTLTWTKAGTPSAGNAIMHYVASA